MGYTTVFNGEFGLNKKLDADTFTLLSGLANTRRMQRNIEGYGVDGEFYIGGVGFMGQDDDETVINNNAPPRTQPSLWLQWTPNEDGTALIWDGGEKFYCSLEWIDYLVYNILKPRGYVVNGVVNAEGEAGEQWYIKVEDNKVSKGHGLHPKAGVPDWDLL